MMAIIGKLIRSKTIPALAAIIMLFGVAVSGQSSERAYSDAPLPAPNSPVVDQAEVIDASTENRIADAIKQFEKSSNPTVQLAVVTVETTGNEPIFDYSLRLARGWGIGTTKKDNPAAILVVAVNDRKYFTQVSRDLEDELTDGIAGSIQRAKLVPEFRKGNYGKGIEDTINAYIETIRAKQSGEEPPSMADDDESDSGVSSETIICCLVVGFIIFVIIVNIIQNSRKNKRGGGGRGSGGSAGSDILGALLTNLIINSSGSSGSSWGGSSSSGSSWSGGSSDWGGFGGGGDFGGGGAGGGW
ncbi:MAG: TPM domain-containing protein [Pyrinomonadaceae bacterium]